MYRRLFFPFLKKFFKPNRNNNNSCIYCGSKNKILTDETIVPDFDIKILPEDIKQKFINKDNGVCMNCGVHQSFNLLNLKEQKIINKIGKDLMTSDTNYVLDQPDKNFIRDFDQRHFSKRVIKWKKYLQPKKLKINRALVIRFWFGKTFDFLEENFSVNDIYGMEMSEMCKRYCSKLKPNVEILENDINGYIDTKNIKNIKFDAIFVFHIINHSININDTLLKLKQILNKGGFIIFSNEIEKKPHNPFHNIHLSEYQLIMFLKKFFRQIDRIDRCEEQFYGHVNPYTKKNDIPDLVAWN
ncbi:MAG: hypothetical protein CMC82_00990 [Flavobacteriaceae bacterium]|nr:hypothetical protein [Flavobacteriaceae bacterium]|tara:strand:- start:4765 stop:5661 length:897 start_codon:yes stop_codon:yes gene_type:complete